VRAPSWGALLVPLTVLIVAVPGAQDRLLRDTHPFRSGIKAQPGVEF